MDMDKLVLFDTCTFFKSLEYFDLVGKFFRWEEKFDEVLESKQKRFNYLKRLLIEVMPYKDYVEDKLFKINSKGKDFAGKYADIQTKRRQKFIIENNITDEKEKAALKQKDKKERDKLVKLLKEAHQKGAEALINEIVKNELVFDYLVENFKGTIGNEIEKCDKNIVLTDKEIKLTRIKKRFLDLAKDYKEIYDSYFVGKIVKDYIEGKVELGISKYAFDELLNHTEVYTKHEINKNFKIFSKSRVEKALQEFVLLTTRSKEVDDVIEEKARQYRELKTNQTSMKNDKNELDVFGDSLIMATASVSGKTLVTLNGKDFIFDKSSDLIENEKIREHVLRVNNLNPEITADVVACSADEYVKGQYLKPTRVSKKFKLVEEGEIDIQKHENLVKEVLRIDEDDRSL